MSSEEFSEYSDGRLNLQATVMSIQQYIYSDFKPRCIAEMVSEDLRGVHDDPLLPVAIQPLFCNMLFRLENRLYRSNHRHGSSEVRVMLSPAQATEHMAKLSLRDSKAIGRCNDFVEEIEIMLR